MSPLVLPPVLGQKLLRLPSFLSGRGGVVGVLTGGRGRSVGRRRPARPSTFCLASATLLTTSLIICSRCSPHVRRSSQLLLGLTWTRLTEMFSTTATRGGPLTTTAHMSLALCASSVTPVHWGLWRQYARLHRVQTPAGLETASAFLLQPHVETSCSIGGYLVFITSLLPTCQSN